MTESKLTPWQRFVRLLSLERKDIYQIILYAIFSGLVSLSLPLGIQAIINLIQGAQLSTSWIVMIILVTIGVIFAGVLQLMQLRIIETIQQRVFVKSSFELSFRFPKIKMQELRNYYPPELANRFFDTLTIQKGMSKVLIDIPAALLQVVFALLLLSFYHPIFIVFGLLLVVFLYIVFQFTAPRGLKTSLLESKYKYKVAQWIQEVARSVISFKLSGNTNLALEKNDALVEKYLGARESHFSIIKLQFIQMIGFKALVTAGLLAIGGALVLNQQMNIGQFVAAEIVILLIITSIEKLIVGLETFYDMLTAIEKLGEVVDLPLEAPNGQKVDLSGDLAISLENVAYLVPGRNKPILSDISFAIAEKSRTIIEGTSGSGKSTLLRILSGVVDFTGGSFYVNNISLQGVCKKNYRSQLGLSLTEEFPFEGTLRENITFGNRDITDNEIMKVVSIVGLSEFIKELPNGLSTELFPEGKQLPHTVSKKIVLARAIIKKPKLLILEYALDQFKESESEAIIDFLCQPNQPWALVVVSNNNYWQQFSTQKLFLNNGTMTIKKGESC